MFTSTNFKHVRILAAALALMGFSITSASAQTTQTANLNVTLADFLVVTLNNTATANLNFNNLSAYQSGVEATVNSQIKVSSNKKYTLNIKAGNDNLANGSEQIASNKISALVVGSASNAIPLTTTDQALAAAQDPTYGKEYSIKYTAPGNDPAFLKSVSGAYTGTVVFTATVD